MSGIESHLNKYLKPTQFSEEVECSICQDVITQGMTFKHCGHSFHQECIKNWFEKCKISCPNCNQLYEKITGTQPPGKMIFSFTQDVLPGHEDVGCIEIFFQFKDGIQTQEHPNPGKKYYGTTRICYLPANEMGLKALQPMVDTFIGKSFFTIGTSVTTGRSDCVIWNGIHCKTRISGGSANYGYPDNTYLDRVATECSQKGYLMNSDINWFKPKYVYLKQELNLETNFTFECQTGKDEITCRLNNQSFTLANPWPQISTFLFLYQNNLVEHFNIDELKGNDF